MNILRVKDSQGNWIDIPAIVGPKGETGATGATGAKGDRGDTVIIATRYEDLTFPVTSGTYCLYADKPYVAKVDIATTEAWTAAHWDEVSFEDEISDLKSAFNGLADTGNVPIDKSVTWQNGWINTSGGISTSSASAFALVRMVKGEIVKIGTNNTNIAIISSTQEESVSVGDTVSVIQTTSGTSQFEEYSYTAKTDINIVLCVKKADYTLSFYRKGDVYAQIEDNENKIHAIEDDFYTLASPVVENGSISPGNGLNISENAKYIRIKSPTSISEIQKLVLVDPTVYRMNVYLYTGASAYSFTRCLQDVNEWNASDATETELYVRYQVTERTQINNLSPSVNYVVSYGGKISLRNMESDILKKVDIEQGSENAGKALVVGDDGNVTVGEAGAKIDETLTLPGFAADAYVTGKVRELTLSRFKNIDWIIGDISTRNGAMNNDSTRKNVCCSAYYRVSDYVGVKNSNNSIYRMDVLFYASTSWQSFDNTKNQIDVEQYYFTESDSKYYFRIAIRTKTDSVLGTSIRYADLLTNKVRTIFQKNNDKDQSVVASKGKSQSNFTLLALTDIHGDAVRMLNAIDYLNGVKEIDAGACLGDISASSYATNCDFYPNAVLNAKKDFFTVIGNHDAGNGTAVSSNGTQQQIFDKFIAPVVSKTGTETTKSYYYKDYASKNLRVIVLNTSDVPDTLLNETTFAVSRGTLGAFSQAQIDWLITTLSSTPTTSHVLLLMHYVNAKMTSDADIHFQSSNYGTTGSTNNAYVGIIPDIISAWVGGTAISQTYTSTVANMPDIEVDADFTNRGTGVFVGVLSGHTHRDIVGYFDNYPTHLACVFSLSNMARGTEDDLPRVEGTKSEDLLTIVSIDTTKRKLYLVRVGAELSDLFVKREDTCINY